MSQVIALFPLSHVLLPGMPLPLHIFEQRYRDLLDDLEGTPGEPGFGVLALRAGAEARTRHVVDAGPDVEQIGTFAEILEIEREDDGTADLLAVGSRRFRVTELIPDGKPYLRAAVEYLPEDDGDLGAGQAQRARDLMDVYDSALVRLAGRPTGSELPDDANQLSYQLAARLPLPPDERQALLAEDSAGSRLVHIARLLRREIALLRGTRSIAIAPAALRMATGVN